MGASKSAKYVCVGELRRGWFVDTDSSQVARGRVVLFYGCTDGAGVPDRTMGAVRVAVDDSVAALRARHPEAWLS